MVLKGGNGGLAGRRFAPRGRRSGSRGEPRDVQDRCSSGSERGGEVQRCADAAVPDPVAARKLAPIEMFKDARAEQALAGTYTQVPAPNPRLTPRDVSAVRSMARGETQADRVAIERYIQHYASNLTNPANVKAIVNEDARTNREIEAATEGLMQPLVSAQKNKNDGFLQTYNAALIRKLPELLKNNLYARTEAMIVLGQMRSPRPEATSLFVKELQDPKQTVWVKLGAARGLALAADEGRHNLETRQATTAARMIVETLDKENDLPWPVTARMLEALGALRQSTSSLLPGQAAAEMSTTAMKYLSDTDAQPTVRTTAAWALGMMRVSAQVPNYNFALIAHHIGSFTAELGGKIATTYTANPVQARFWTGLLLYRVYPAFTGETDVRESGLLHVPNHPQINTDRPVIQEIAKRVQAVLASAVNLDRSAGGLVAAARRDLQVKVADLKSFLDKNPPADVHLLPGGPEFPVNKAPAPVATEKTASPTRAASRGPVGR